MKLVKGLQDGDALVADPTLKEAAAAEGEVMVVVNTAGQVCAVQQLGGLGLTLEQVSPPLDLTLHPLSLPLPATPDQASTALPVLRCTHMQSGMRIFIARLQAGGGGKAMAAACLRNAGLLCESGLYLWARDTLTRQQRDLMMVPHAQWCGGSQPAQ